MEKDVSSKPADLSYISAELLLKAEMDEYRVEDAKNQNMNTRSGIFISFASAVFLFSINSIVGSDIFVTNASSCWAFSAHLAAIIIIVVGEGVLLYSLNIFIKVCTPTIYRRIRFEDFLNFTSKPTDLFAMSLCMVYKDAISHNRIVNCRKATYLQQGIALLKYAVICISLGFSLLKFVKYL